MINELQVGDSVVVSRNEKDNYIHKKNCIRGEVVSFASFKIYSTRSVRVKIPAPWGTTSNWYRERQLDKEETE